MTTAKTHKRAARPRQIRAFREDDAAECYYGLKLKLETDKGLTQDHRDHLHSIMRRILKRYNV